MLEKLTSIIIIAVVIKIDLDSAKPFLLSRQCRPLGNVNKKR